MENLVNTGLILSYVMIVVGGLSALVLPLINSLSQPKTLIYTLAGLGAILVVYMISWAISGGEVTPEYSRYGVNESSSKVIGGAIIMMYLLLGITIIGIVYTEVSKMFK